MVIVPLTSTGEPSGSCATTRKPISSPGLNMGLSGITLSVTGEAATVRSLLVVSSYPVPHLADRYVEGDVPLPSGLRDPRDVAHGRQLERGIAIDRPLEPGELLPPSDVPRGNDLHLPHHRLAERVLTRHGPPDRVAGEQPLLFRIDPDLVLRQHVLFNPHVQLCLLVACKRRELPDAQVRFGRQRQVHRRHAVIVGGNLLLEHLEPLGVLHLYGRSRTARA